MAMNNPFDEMDWTEHQREQVFDKLTDLPVELQDHVIAFSEQSVPGGE
jgi:hypothetical protein